MSPDNANIAGGVVGVLVAAYLIAENYKDVDIHTETIEFKCMSWQAPNGGKNCVKCNDDPIEQIVIKKAGIAQNCGESTDWIRLPNGREIQNRNLVCQRFDGKWELIPEYAGR